MKPIIIGVNKDGKVDMTLDEFRKHMDDAYNQGYNDKSSWSLTNIAAYDTNKWWNSVGVCNAASASKEVK